MRLIQDEGDQPMASVGSVSNPLFFDLEAGVVGELPSGGATRLGRTLGGFGSAGVGQEFGRVGPRFIWRVGRFVIISDTGQVAGEATAGTGIRF